MPECLDYEKTGRGCLDPVRGVEGAYESRAIAGGPGAVGTPAGDSLAR